MDGFSKAKKVSYMAMLLTLISVLSIFEASLPALPFLPPGVKLGLANIVTMFALIFISKKTAFILTILKAVFVGLTRGFTAGILSLSGGILSIISLIIVLVASKNKATYIFLSVVGAIFHNIGQLIAITIILESVYTLYYFPILIIAGIIMGTVTGTLLKVVIPALSLPLKKSH